ncbi:MAG: lipoate--protein ligase family protein [Planctomycetota bacterium]
MVTVFREPRPDLIVPNPGGAEDPLGESVLDKNLPAVRIFEPQDIRIVIGRHQDPEREVLTLHARADGIPIHRRVAGGGAVVLAPGMVVVALRLPRRGLDVDAYFRQVAELLMPPIQSLLPEGVRVVLHGHGDLALIEGTALPRKILGASLRQSRMDVYYLGVLMVADAVALMQRYLAFPSREPAYRAGRGHADFCTDLGRHQVSTAALKTALRAACQQVLRL